MQIRSISAAALAVALSAGLAQGETITFDGFGHGEIVAQGLVATEIAPGVYLKVDSFAKSFDIGAIFDTSLGGASEDPDLQGPAANTWDGGNIASANGDAPVMGNALIISEENEDSNNPGFVGGSDGPDDEGARPAGSLEFDFGQAGGITSFGIDIIDLERASARNGSIKLFSAGVEVGDLSLSDETLGGAFGDIEYGDNSVNRIDPLLAADFGVDFFDIVLITVGGSSAYDNIFYSLVPPPPGNLIPLPSAAMLGLVGCVGVASRRRR
ncbi:MAG: hypothetical protein AAGB51_07550 [Planctomycetota bacterium]